MGHVDKGREKEKDREKETQREREREREIKRESIRIQHMNMWIESERRIEII